MDARTPRLPRATTPAALLDALRYPLTGAALPANAVLAIGHAFAGSLFAVFALPLHLVLWLAFYKYALEVLAATGAGRADPPEVLTHVDDDVHRRHIGLQLLLLLATAIASTLLASPERWFVLLALALATPGMLLSLAASQNVAMALNPANWLLVARQIGVAYGLLSACWFMLFALHVNGREWLAAAPGPLPALVFHALLQYCWLVAFRWLGLALREHAGALDYRIDAVTRPTLARDREADALQRTLQAARRCEDPARRIELLAEVLGRSSDESVHREYRQALRGAGRTGELQAHARSRVAELLASARPGPALSLAVEALDDDPGFTLADGDFTARLLERGCRSGLLRQAAQITTNYCRAYPRRRDMQPLALQAAALLHDRLQQPDVARELLQLAAANALGADEAEAARRALARLDAGQPLAEAAGYRGS